MNLEKFNSLIGQDSYVRCNSNKERLDAAIVTTALAKKHLEGEGTIGWWVRSGYIVVDIDEGKEEALKIVKHLGLNTLMAKTPKGLHLFFKTDKDFPQKIGMVLPCGLKCDFRCANKGYVILPYGQNGRSFNTIENIAELPFEFTPLLNRKESLLGKKEGDGRNQLLFSHLMAYKNKGATAEQVQTMADVINSIVFSAQMPEAEINKLVDSTTKYTAQLENDNTPYLIYSDKGKPTGVNNRAIVDYFVNRGDIFVIAGEVFQYMNGIYQEASSYVRNSIKEMINVDVLITQSRIMETYRLLIDDTRLHRSTLKLNQETHLINFKNGVWNTNTKSLIPHDSKYLQTIQIPHNYEKAKKPLEETYLYKFLTEEVELDEANVNMILDFMAYCMGIDASLKSFMILQGQSNTGKSVLIRFIDNLVGRENTSALSMHELNMRFYPAQLYNRLVNSCADNGSLALQSIENLKKITGGDPIMNERKGKEPFFFIPFAKLIFSFNQLPLQLEEKSNAFYLRMRILSMQKRLNLNNAYVERLCNSVEEIIPHLMDRLPLEDIPTTHESNMLVENLRQDSDSIHAFLENCTIKNSKYWISKKALYEAYLFYSTDLGKEAHKKHTFLRHIRSQGHEEVRHPKTGEAGWKGIKLRKEK